MDRFSCNDDKILVIKSDRELHIFSNEILIKTYPIALGGVPEGHKEFEGDEKTPEGNYYIDGKNHLSSYHKNLGISYPNLDDITYAESIGENPGGDIKIHGQPNGEINVGKLHLLTDWTLGCIAVTNEEIDELYKLIKIGTPIEIKP